MFSTQSPFLDILPPELRLRIYEHLLVASTPLKGPLARQFQSETYNLHTSILRTNKRVYSEARYVFFGRNTFYVNAVPPPNGQDDEEGSGAFEPPLQLKDLPLVRQLQIDLLYYPRVLRTTIGRDGWGWQPVCTGADRYATSISYLLGAVKHSLRSLELAADVRPYMCHSPTPFPRHADDSETDVLNIKKFLTGFHTADRNWRFKQALVALALTSIELRFDFPESYFDFVVEKDVLLQDNLVHLAGQMLIARSEIQLRATLDELSGDCRADGQEKSQAKENGVFGAPAQITLPWPCQGAGDEVRSRYGGLA